MIEPVLKVYRIERPEYGAAEYRMTVNASILENSCIGVPEKYLAHVLANKMREYVNTALTDEIIETVILKSPTVCPCCHREFGDHQC